MAHCALSRHPHILALHAVFRLPTHQWVLVMDCRNLIGGSVIAFWITFLVECELVSGKTTLETSDYLANKSTSCIFFSCVGSSLGPREPPPCFEPADLSSAEFVPVVMPLLILRRLECRQRPSQSNGPSLVLKKLCIEKKHGCSFQVLSKINHECRVYELIGLRGRRFLNEVNELWRSYRRSLALLQILLQTVIGHPSGDCSNLRPQRITPTHAQNFKPWNYLEHMKT